MSVSLPASVCKGTEITKQHLLKFAKIWLDSLENNSELTEDEICQFFPDANKYQLCDIIDEGRYEPLNNYLTRNINDLIEEPVLRNFLVRYLPIPMVYSKLSDHFITNSVTEIIRFIENGGFHVLEYKQLHNSNEYQKYKQEAELAFRDMIVRCNNHYDVLIPILMNSYCYELDTTIQYLIKKSLLDNLTETLHTCYRLNLTESIKLLEQLGYHPNSDCIGYMMLHEYPTANITDIIQKYRLVVTAETVYQNLTTTNWSKLLCFIYENQPSPPTINDLEQLSKRWAQPEAIKYLTSLGINPNIQCVINSIQFGDGSPYQMIVASCQSSVITRNYPKLLTTLQRCAGTQDIDFYKILHTLINKDQHIIKPLTELIHKYRNNYPDSPDMNAVISAIQ